jgi:hypothetical protein
MTLDVRMKTYACFKCGKTLESSECVQTRGRLLTRRLCPVCGAPVGVSGAALIVVGLLWLVLWGLIVSDEAQLAGFVGGVVFVVVGIVRLVLQFRARRGAKC